MAHFWEVVQGITIVLCIPDEDGPCLERVLTTLPCDAAQSVPGGRFNLLYSVNKNLELRVKKRSQEKQSWRRFAQPQGKLHLCVTFLETKP